MKCMGTTLRLWLVMATFGLTGLFVNMAQARSLAEIIASKEMRVCIALSIAVLTVAEPEGCRENCTMSGIIPEQVQAFARQLPGPVRVKFIRVDWDEQFFNKEGKVMREAAYTPQLLASGQCDFYPANLTQTPWRLKKLDFVTLFPSRMMVVTLKSRKPSFKKLADLAGLRVATEKDSSFHTWVDQQNQSTFASNLLHLTLLDDKKSLQAVLDGKVDFTLLDADMAVWAMRQSKQLAVAFPVGVRDEIGWAFRKQDQDLQLAAGRFFEKQRKDDRSDLNQLWRQHFGLSLNQFITLVNSAQ